MLDRDVFEPAVRRWWMQAAADHRTPARRGPRWAAVVEEATVWGAWSIYGGMVGLALWLVLRAV